MSNKHLIKKYQSYISNTQWHINTNTPPEEEIKKLSKQIDSWNEIVSDLLTQVKEEDEIETSKDEEITHFHIADNSDALHEWLDTKGISYISNGQFTSIGIKEDIFSIGMKFGIYKHNAQKVSKDQELIDKLDSVIVYGHNLSEQQKNKIEEIVMQYFTEKVKSLHNKYDHGEVNNIYNLAIFDVLEILK